MTQTPSDPTGQAKNRNKSTRRLVGRLRVAERQVKALFRQIPKTSRTVAVIVNAERTTVYDYNYDQASFEQSVRFIVNSQLLDTQTDVRPFDWYWNADIELPYRQGTAEEVRDFNQLISVAILGGAILLEKVPVEQVLLSEQYRTALRLQQTTAFADIKSLSTRVADQVIQRVNAGIEAGELPSIISADISKRFGVAQSSAKRIAETEVNKAYNDAKLSAADLMSERTGLRSAVVHISALTPTTRQTHADRHGNVYTTTDQLQWWNMGVNRINCKCTTETVLVDKKGKVIDKPV